MSRVRANSITNKNADGAPNFTHGAIVTGVVTATSFSGSGANLTGIDATALKDSGGSVKVQANSSGAVVTGVLTATGNVKVGGVLTYEDVTNVDSVGVITARNGIRVGAGKSIGSDSGTVSYYGDGSNLTGVSAGEFFGNATGVSTSKNVGIQTNDVNRADLVGAGNSFVGMYLGDGFIGFPTYLGRSGGYYITTSINALNAGPITLGSTMTLHGAWVIV